MSDLPVERVLVIGLAAYGRAVAKALRSRGSEVTVVDDHPSTALRRAAELLDVELVEAPNDDVLRELVNGCTAVMPSPGVGETHVAYMAAADTGTPILGELDLAGAWDDRPFVAITGTDGKTTVTTLVTDMLLASGRAAVAAGNNELPLVTAIDDPLTDVFVVEASSFRLGQSAHFHPLVATWLNFAEDHLDVHSSIDSYELAKARIWSELKPGSTAVANADDPVVMRHVLPHNRTVTFGVRTPADFHVDLGGTLRTDAGEELVNRDELVRSLPHDLANALAASATALAGGGTLDGVRSALRAFRGLPHRVEQVCRAGGIEWYDDSKATAPHATMAAVRGFDSAVLIAGGRNKDLDLSPLAGLAPHLRGVIAIGEAARDVEAVFAGAVPVRVASTMAGAVAEAAELAVAGDAVLLSPGCASYDWYGGYAERGDDFQSEVRRQILGIEDVAR